LALLGVSASLLMTACSGSAGELLDDLLDGGGHGSGHGSGGHHNPPPPAGLSCDVTWDGLYGAIESDILGLDAEDREFVRYVTLANRLVAGECGLDVLDDRAALTDVIQGFSQAAQVVAPELIPGDTETFRFDLRDYALDDSHGPFAVGQVQFVDAWEAIAGNTPYAVEFQGDRAENVKFSANTLSPVLFLDAVVDGATRAGLPTDDPAALADALDAFDQDVDLDVVGGDTLFPPELLANEVNRLDPALAGIDDGFKVDRDDWGGLYANSLCVLSVANENRPTDEVCISQ
jgi:hypothetical protein